MVNISFPNAFQRLIDRFSSFSARLAPARGLALCDLRQRGGLSLLSGRDLRQAVPASVGVQLLCDGHWWSTENDVVAREAGEDLMGAAVGVPYPHNSRGYLTDAIAADAGAAAEQLKKSWKWRVCMLRRAGFSA